MIVSAVDAGFYSYTITCIFAMDSNIILAERIAQAFPLTCEADRTGKQLRAFIQEFLSSHSIVISDPERLRDLEYRVRAALQLRLLRRRQIPEK